MIDPKAFFLTSVVTYINGWACVRALKVSIIELVLKCFSSENNIVTGLLLTINFLC